MGAPSDSQQVTEERSKNVVDFAAQELADWCEKKAAVGVNYEEEKAGRAAGCRHEAAPPAPAGLPCRSSNNCDARTGARVPRPEVIRGAIGYRLKQVGAGLFFAWVSPKAKRFRERVAFLASVLGRREFDEIKRVLGRRWAYRLRRVIATGSDEELRAEVMALAAARVTSGRLRAGPPNRSVPPPGIANDTRTHYINKRE